jgi:predicted nuclease of predicted toxin-antitoxin system
MKLLLDANISWRIVKDLSVHFGEVNHISDFLPHDAKDSEIWELALNKGFTIITNDMDFVNLLTIKGWPPKIIILKQGNQSNKAIRNLLITNKNELLIFDSNDSIGILEFI